MKKSLIIAAAAFLSSVMAGAQQYGYSDRFKDNWYVSGAVGVNALNQNVGSFDSYARLGLDFTLGKWFSPMFGARGGWQGLKMSSVDNTYWYNYLHGDILWDIFGTAEGYDPDRLWTLAPYVNMGLVLNTQSGSLASKGFGAGVGLLNSFRLTDRVSAYLDIRTTMMNERSIGSPRGHILMVSGLAGLQFKIGNQGWDMPFPEAYDEGFRRNGRFFEDWFMAVGGGVDAMTNVRKWTGTFAPSAEFNIGKWLAPYAGARIGVQGLNMRGAGDGGKYSFAYVHADAMWNFTNTVLRKKNGHIWNFIPYAHFGVFNTNERYGGRIKTEFASGAGLYNTFAVSRDFDIFADFRATAVNGRASEKPSGVLVQTSILAGLAYNIGGNRGWNPHGHVRSGKAGSAAPDERMQYSRGPLEYNGFGGNWFAYAAGGISGVSMSVRNLDNLSIRPAFDLGIGKYFSPSFGARLGYQSNRIEAHGRDYTWNFIHGDVLWDLRGTIAGYDPERIWSIAPYASMGASLVSRKEGGMSRNFAAGAGLLNSWRLSGRLSAFLDLRGILLSERQFGSSSGYAAQGSAMAGLMLDLGKYRWDSDGTGIILNNLGGNWFFQMTGGLGLVMDSWSEFSGRPAPAIELSLGKWFSPEWGGRMGFLFENTIKSGNRVYDNFYLHADVLWNMSNAIGGYRPDRVYTASPYLHFGVMNTWNHYAGSMGRDYSAGVGLLSDFKVDDRMSFVLDLRGRAMSGRLTGKGGGKALAGDALFGISYSLSEGGWRPVRDREGLRGPLAVSTNLLGWADLATVNASVEYAVGRHWSADVVFEINNWSFRNGDLQDKRRGYSIGARYWPWYTYSGMWMRGFVAAEDCNAAGMPFDYMNGVNDKYGAGLSLGYSLMLARHLNLDFGVGFWGGVRKTYGSPKDGFIAPKDLRISLMFVL
ncbi:MAG: DUF3575 domain-containing protein [Candidatus Cryptobacteroides sp.]